LEIAEVKRLLSTACLVTLTDTGGAGKSRLALGVLLSTVLLAGVYIGVFLLPRPSDEPADPPLRLGVNMKRED
jgi:hypothetical protein